MLETNTFCAGDEHFSARDEHFSARDERFENACSNFRHTHRYLRLPVTFKPNYVVMIAIYRFSPPKTGGITFSYSPPSILHPQVIICNTVAFSAGLNGLQQN